MSDLNKTLSKIQKDLKVPKNRRNTFGEYNYRSLEDIVEAVKTILPSGVFLFLSDEVVEVGGRIYVKASATLTDGTGTITTTGYAREEEDRKKMHPEQLTGCASSYARKYALNGLFCIDDTKDADTMEQPDDKKAPPKQESTPPPETPERAWLKDAVNKIDTFTDKQELLKWNLEKDNVDMIAKLNDEQKDYYKTKLHKAITKLEEKAA